MPYTSLIYRAVDDTVDSSPAVTALLVRCTALYLYNTAPHRCSAGTNDVRVRYGTDSKNALRQQEMEVTWEQYY